MNTNENQKDINPARTSDTELHAMREVPLEEAHHLAAETSSRIEITHAHTNLEPAIANQEVYDEETIEEALAVDGIEVAEDDIRSEARQDFVEKLFE